MYLTNDQDLESIVRNALIGICILDAETFVTEMLNDKFLEVAGNNRIAYRQQSKVSSTEKSSLIDRYN